MNGRVLLAYLGLCSVLAGLVIGLFNREVLSASFFKDSARLELFIAGGRLASKDGSYRGTAQVYRFIGLTQSPTAAGLVGYALFILLVFAACRHGRFKGFPNSIATVLLLALPLAAGIFLVMYTKELFVVAVVLVLALCPLSLRGEAMWLAAAVAYGAWVRPYWLIIVVLYVGFRMLGHTISRLALLVP